MSKVTDVSSFTDTLQVLFLLTEFFNSYDGVPYHIETTPLVFIANHWFIS